MLKPCKAAYFDGKSGKSQEISLSLLGDDLVAKSPTSGFVLFRIEKSLLEMERLGPRLLQLRNLDGDDAAFFQVSDPIAIEQLSGLKVKSTFVFFQQNARLWLLVLLVTTVVLGTAFVYGSDIASGWLAHKIPLEKERSWTSSLSVDDFGWTSCELSNKENGVIKQLETFFYDSKLFPFQGPIWVVDLEMQNAFALPGGRIVLTRGFIEKIQSPAELYGVLAHEIQHVQQRHIMKGLIRSSLLTFMWQFALGDFSGLIVLDPTTISKLVSLKYSRAMESEADEKGIEFLNQKGITAVGMADFFRRMQETAGSKKMPKLAQQALDFVSTHPGTEDRIQSIEQKNSVKKKESKRILTTDSFRVFQAACKD